MVFSDLKFIYLFLPAFLCIYYLLPQKLKNTLIFLASVIFYALGTLDRPIYAVLFVLAVFVTYLSGLFIQYFPKYKKIIFIISAIYNFGLLFIFKYEGFLVTNLNRIFSIDIPVLELVLPVGISFYTFQAMSYVIDVYRGTIKAEKSFINYGAYLAMFPQLVAGPIVTYPEVSRQMKRRAQSVKNFSEGLKLFVVGLGSKVIIANNISGVWNDAISIGFESISTPLAWLAAAAFSLQLYFDFYGYSLMAKGMGRMIGFNLPDNFNDPYISVSMTEFWRRWHITLSRWFRDYVYIPLGGNRRGSKRTIFNLFVVWMLTGLWHGANWNFIIWGIFIFAIITIEKLGLKSFFDKHRILGHAYMLFLIPIFWSVFAITDLSQIGVFFSRMFPFFRTPEFLVSFDASTFFKKYGVLFIIGIIFSTPIGKKIYYSIKNNIIGAVVLAAIFGLSVYFLCIGLNDPFLYFRF